MDFLFPTIIVASFEFPGTSPNAFFLASRTHLASFLQEQHTGGTLPFLFTAGSDIHSGIAWKDSAWLLAHLDDPTERERFLMDSVELRVNTRVAPPRLEFGNSEKRRRINLAVADAFEQHLNQHSIAYIRHRQ